MAITGSAGSGQSIRQGRQRPADLRALPAGRRAVLHGGVVGQPLTRLGASRTDIGANPTHQASVHRLADREVGGERAKRGTVEQHCDVSARPVRASRDRQWEIIATHFAWHWLHESRQGPLASWTLFSCPSIEFLPSSWCFVEPPIDGLPGMLSPLHGCRRSAPPVDASSETAKTSSGESAPGQSVRNETAMPDAARLMPSDGGAPVRQPRRNGPPMLCRGC